MSNRVFIRLDPPQIAEALALLDIPDGEPRQAVAVRVARALPLLHEHAPWARPLPLLGSDALLTAAGLRAHVRERIDRRRLHDAERLLTGLTDLDAFVADRRAAGDDPAYAVVRVLHGVRSLVRGLPCDRVLPPSPRVPAPPANPRELPEPNADYEPLPLPDSLRRSVEEHREHLLAIRGTLRPAPVQRPTGLGWVPPRDEYQSRSVPFSTGAKWFGMSVDRLRALCDAGEIRCRKESARAYVFDIEQLTERGASQSTIDDADSTGTVSQERRAKQKAAEDSRRAEARDRMRRKRAGKLGE
jgi:hypothetical protein